MLFGRVVSMAAVRPGDATLAELCKFAVLESQPSVIHLINPFPFQGAPASYTELLEAAHIPCVAEAE